MHIATRLLLELKLSFEISWGFLMAWHIIICFYKYSLRTWDKCVLFYCCLKNYRGPLVQDSYLYCFNFQILILFMYVSCQQLKVYIEICHLYLFLHVVSLLICIFLIISLFKSVICIFLEKEMTTDSNTLAWRIPWTEEPAGYSL